MTPPELSVKKFSEILSMHNNNRSWTYVVSCKGAELHASFCNEWVTMQHEDMQNILVTKRILREIRKSKFRLITYGSKIGSVFFSFFLGAALTDYTNF